MESGAEVLVIAREKEVTLDLLEAYEIPHLSVGRAGRKGWGGLFGELLRRDLFLIREGREFRPDVVLTRNPAGVQAARVLGATGVFDTDDGRSVGIHYYAAAPFAHVITAPDCLPESFGSKERRYPSYKSLAYVHPDLFTPDPSIRSKLGIGANERFSVLRLVAHAASHDRRAAGIDADLRGRLVDLLQRHGRVLISSEAALDPELSGMQLKIPPESMHDVLAEAAIVVGDSQTVATEAALLATPAVRINTWAHATPHITELEERYGLAFSFAPEEKELALSKVDALTRDPEVSSAWQMKRERLLSEKVNLTNWYADFVLGLER